MLRSLLLSAAAAASLLFVLWLPPPVQAADPVKVEVSGVEGDAEANVRQALALPYGMVRDGKVDRLWLERFAKQAREQARVALQPYGYYNAEIAVTVREPKPGDYRLAVNIIPGERVRITEVDVKLQGGGAKEMGLRRLVDAFPLKRGDVLLQPLYEQAKGEMKSHATELGYLDADFPRREIRIAPGATTARILLTFDTGPRYYFDGVRIEGADQYPDDFLKRFLGFRRGDPFSYAKLAETQLNFANSARFKEVVVTPEKENAVEQQVPVLVRLTEVPRRTLRTGVGFGTDTGPRFSVMYRDLNLFEEGHDLDMSLFIAQRLQGIAARYIRPSAKDMKSSTSLQLNLQREDITTYESRLIALEVARNRSLGKGEMGSAYVKFQQENFTIGEEDSGSTLILPGYRFTKESFDNMVRPSRGYRYSLDLRGTHPVLLSDAALLQFIAEGNYLKIGRAHV